jgi:hypothetical protein
LQLNAAQKSAFVQLSCFEGPFARSATEILWGTDDSTTTWILSDLLRRGLVARSMQQGVKDDVFYLHPLLRDYARQKLNLFRLRSNGPFLGMRRYWASGAPNVGL